MKYTELTLQRGGRLIKVVQPSQARLDKLLAAGWVVLEPTVPVVPAPTPKRRRRSRK